ncbi:MAG: hypothetical protein WAS56_05495 [Saprospiraceae bacterium]|jgi:hypothetical protein
MTKHNKPNKTADNAQGRKIFIIAAIIVIVLMGLLYFAFQAAN